MYVRRRKPPVGTASSSAYAYEMSSSQYIAAERAM
jgi:hypothetical protein